MLTKKKFIKLTFNFMGVDWPLPDEHTKYSIKKHNNDWVMIEYQILNTHPKERLRGEKAATIKNVKDFNMTIEQAILKFNEVCIQDNLPKEQ